MSTESTPRPAVSALDWPLRALAALGLGASIVLFLEYTSDVGLGCGAGGCSEVRASSWASILGLPTPVYGVAFFAGVLVLSVLSGALARRLLTLAAVVGGVAGAGFLLIQTFEIHAFCVYCLTVDVSSIVITLLALAKREPTQDLTGAEWGVLAAVLLVGIGLPFVYGFATNPAPAPKVVKTGATPSCVASELTADAVTIVAFSDFECPYCRMEHFTLKNLLESMRASLGKPVRLVRRHFPLSQHKYSRDAALASICADQAGFGDIMTDYLFSTDDLSLPAISRFAAQFAAPDAFRACLASPDATRRLTSDIACGTSADVDSLPTIYIGEQRLVSLQKDDVLLGALRKAAGAPAPTR
jgi:uncharacterized membrane protein